MTSGKRKNAIPFALSIDFLQSSFDWLKSINWAGDSFSPLISQSICKFSSFFSSLMNNLSFFMQPTVKSDKTDTPLITSLLSRIKVKGSRLSHPKTQINLIETWCLTRGEGKVSHSLPMRRWRRGKRRREGLEKMFWSGNENCERWEMRGRRSVDTWQKLQIIS